MKNKYHEWQVRATLLEYEDLREFSYTDTVLPCVYKNSKLENRRSDFTYALQDRVVFLEVDENEHRYNVAECERKREQQLQEGVPADMFVVLVRFNPTPRLG